MRAKISAWVLCCVINFNLLLLLEVTCDTANNNLGESEDKKILNSFYDKGINGAEKISTAIAAIYTEVNASKVYANITIDCVRDLKFARQAWISLANCFENQTCIERYRWITEVLDAQGRRPSGVFDGNKYWLGGYKQCLSIDSNTFPESNRFVGQHCKAFIFSDAIRDYVEVGICAPRSCSSQDLQGLVSTTANLGDFEIKCEQRTRLSEDFRAIGTIILFCIILLLVAAGTIADVILFQNYSSKNAAASYDTESILIKGLHKVHVKDYCTRSILAFTLFSNGAKLFSVKRITSQIDCLHGIRFMSSVWIIFCHSYFLVFKADNMIRYMRSTPNLLLAFFLQGNFAVDAFFVLSGLLATYNFFKHMEKQSDDFKNIFYWIKFYVHRYVRLIPTTIMLMLLYSEIFYYLSAGPLWFEQSHRCENTWWNTVLCYNNFLKDFTETKCLVLRWSSLVDFQIHIFLPFILVPFYLFPAIAYAIWFLLIAANVVANGAEYYLNNYPPNCLLIDSDGYLGSMKCAEGPYQLPHFRYGPYIVGVLMGHVIFKLRGQQPELNRVIKVVGWMLAVAVTGVVIFLPFLVQLSPFAAGVYSGTSRLAFSFVVAWVIYACATGNSRILNTFLSWSCWIPLSRLSFCAFLIHTHVYEYIVGSGERPVHIDSNMTLIFEGLKCLVVTFLLAVIAHLTLELPTLELGKIFIKAGTTDRVKPNAEKKKIK